MSNYVKATNFTAKDSLPSGNAGKIIKGAEIDTEFTAIASAISSKADLNSPALTGTPTAPTASLNTNTTQLATTAFVQAAGAALVPTGIISLWYGSIANIPSGWALCNGSNNTPDLRNRFVIGAHSDVTGVANTTITGGNTVTGGTKDAIVVSHTHTVTASGTTGSTSTEHTHSLSASGTTGNQSADHTHSGTTGGQSVGHTHTFSGTSSGQSQSHSHSVTDPGHAHALNGSYLAFGTASVSGVLTASGNTNTATATTGISLGNASQDHTHTYSGTTAGTSGDHTHNFTTGGVSSNHTHTVTVTGTSGNMSTNATHTHSVSVTGNTASTGSDGTNANLPPYYALAYIMKL